METSVSSTTKEAEEANEITSSIKLKLVKNGQQYYIARHKAMENRVNQGLNNNIDNVPEQTHLSQYGRDNNWHITSHQISGSFQQSLRFRPLPIWSQNYPRLGYAPMNGQVELPVPSALTRSAPVANVVSTQAKDVNQNVFNDKTLTKPNVNGNGFPFLKNCFQQKPNYYNINNNSINGSTFMDRNISYLVQPESTCAEFTPFNQNYHDERTAKDPLIKQLLNKKSETNVSCSVRTVPLSKGSEQSNYLCNRCRLAEHSTGKVSDSDVICVKQTNCVSTQTDHVRKFSNKSIKRKQLSGQQLSAWQMNRVLRAYLTFANEMKTKILYKERTSASLTPNEELAMEQRLRLMWNGMPFENKKEYLLRVEKEGCGDQKPTSTDQVNSSKDDHGLPFVFISDAQREALLQNNQVKNCIQNFLASKRQKTEINSNIKTNSCETKCYLEDSPSNDHNIDVVVHNKTSCEKTAQNTSTIDHAQLNDLFSADTSQNKRTLFRDVEELARPHQNIMLKPNKKLTTNTSIETMDVTTERSE